MMTDNTQTPSETPEAPATAETPETPETPVSPEPRNVTEAAPVDTSGTILTALENLENKLDRVLGDAENDLELVTPAHHQPETETGTEHVEVTEPETEPENVESAPKKRGLKLFRRR